MSVASTGSADSAASANQFYNSSSRSGRAGSRIIANTEQGTSPRKGTIPDLFNTGTAPSQLKKNSFV